MRLRMTVLTVVFLGVAALPPADGRGHHGGFSRHHTMNEESDQRGRSASDQRHANDDYVKAAEQEEDKLLSTKIKSICSGC
jgi:hypothetical protein